MLGKLKETALNDLFLATLVIYCSGWVLLILGIIIKSFFDDGGYKSRLTGEVIARNPSFIFEQIILLGIVILPVILLMALIHITISVNRLEKKLA